MTQENNEDPEEMVSYDEPLEEVTAPADHSDEPVSDDVETGAGAEGENSDELTSDTEVSDEAEPNDEGPGETSEDEGEEDAITDGVIPEELAPDEDAQGRSIIEAVLTASDAPVTTSQLAGLVGDASGAKEVRRYIDELNEVYIKTGRAFRVTEVAGGFQFSVHHEYAPWIRRLLREKPARLSQAALEVLSIVAFKQPITKAEVEHIRGVASDGVLRNLMEKRLVRMAGRSDGVGRPLLYGTARDFLKFFGLKTLADLPKVREVEEMLREEQEMAPLLPGVEPAGSESDPASEGAQEKSDGETEPANGGEGSREQGEALDNPEHDLATNSEEEQHLEDGDDAGQVGQVSDEDSNIEEGEAAAGASEQISGEGGSRVEKSV
jgi:segregation and condensation protein B